MSDAEPVRYEQSDHVVTITLDRPEAMNSLDNATKEALLAALARAADDDGVRAVVLTGSGRAFCVGQDLREHAGNLAMMPNDEVWSTVTDHYSPIASTIATMAKPVIAAVNGTAAGAGMSIAMVCDWRFAAASASFSTAFSGVGLSCDTGCSWTLPRLVGRGRAMELLLWPRKVDAEEALAIGLVTWVVPDERLAEEAADAARRLAAGPPLAFAAIKQSVRYAATHSLTESLAFEAEAMARTGGSQDHRDAVGAFLAKERPTFHGR